MTQESSSFLERYGITKTVEHSIENVSVLIPATDKVSAGKKRFQKSAKKKLSDLADDTTQIKAGKAKSMPKTPISLLKKA